MLSLEIERQCTSLGSVRLVQPLDAGEQALDAGAVTANAIAAALILMND